MNIPVETIKELREITCASIGHCKKALIETKGDIKQAVLLLRKQGLEIAAGKLPWAWPALVAVALAATL